MTLEESERLRESAGQSAVAAILRSRAEAVRRLMLAERLRDEDRARLLRAQIHDHDREVMRLRRPIVVVPVLADVTALLRGES